MTPPSRSFLVLALGSALLLAIGCTDTVVKPNVGVDATSSRCKQQPEQQVKLQAGIEAGMTQGLLKFEGQAGYEQLVEIKNSFDTLQADYAQMSYQLCEDSATGAISQAYYERRRECLDQGLIAMRSLNLVLDEKKNADDSRDMAWELEAKMAWLQDILMCKEQSPQALAPEKLAAAEEITLTAYLICQRKVGDKFVDVPECTETPLAENDRVKIGFRSDKDARFYVLNYNDTGLFQMIFPDRGIANEITAGRDYILPPDSWLELDDQKDVVEHLQIVASLEKIDQLEALRGAYFEPKAAPDQKKVKAPKEAIQTRGILEPVITRGFKQKGKPPVKLEVGEQEPVNTVPMIASRPGVNVIEFKLYHK